MVKFSKTAFYMMWIFIIHIISFVDVMAQSKHAMYWYVNGYEYDFSQSPVKIIPHKEDAEWYVDSNGKHVLTYSDGKIYDENLNVIIENCTSGFFVPSPYNKNLVFYFEPNKYTIIDLKTKSAIGSGEGPYFTQIYDINAIVHHSQCDKMWMFVEQNEVIAKYLLTSEGVEKVGEIQLHQIYPPEFPRCYISLSKDCQHYVASYFIDWENKSGVTYGNFDRETGEFEIVTNQIFEDYNVVQGAIIAPDNSRLYCVLALHNDARSYKIVEYPIENNIPQFDKMKLVVEKKINAFAFSLMYYAIDGKIYVFENSTRFLSTLSLDANGETKYEEIYNFGHIGTGSHPLKFVSSWYMDNQCPESDSKNICDNIPVPELYFENSYVCYGESLNIVFSSKESCSIELIDGNGNVSELNNISNGVFPLTKIPGIYKITKIRYGECEYVYPIPITGEVGAKFSPLVIKEIR